MRFKHPVPLYRQIDLLLILGIVTVDLGLTIYGISTGQGVEANPFYVPFTSSVPLMLAGLALYYVILLLGGYVFTGMVRATLASIAFGMHVAGTATWIRLLFGIDFLNIFWFTLLASSGTILFYLTLYPRSGHD